MIDLKVMSYTHFTFFEMNIVGNFLPLDHFSCNLEAGLFSLPQKYIKKRELKFSTFSKVYFYLFFIFK